MRDFYERFSFVLENETFYSSPAAREACTNYRNSRNRGIDDPLDMFAEVIGKSAADTFLHAAMQKSIVEAVKEATIKMGGTWVDD